MLKDYSRREFLYAAGLTSAAIALAEGGLVRRAWADTAFTVGMEGGSWGEGIIASFVTAPKFEEKYNVKVQYAHNTVPLNQAKVLAEIGNPSLSVAGTPDLESVRIAEAGGYQDYDLSIVTNYNDIIPPARLGSYGGLKNWHAGIVSTVWSAVWNTKHAKKPTSWQDMLNPAYKGRIGLPTFTSNGEAWMHALNTSLGGKSDNLDKAFAFVAEVAKKQDAIFIQNTDHGMQLFTREEIVFAPFWNGRAFQLQGQGVAVEFEPVPGTFQYAWALHITKGTKFAELGNRLVNLSLDPEYQLEMLRRTGYPPTNSKSKMPAGMENRKLPSDKLGNLVPLDFPTMIQSSAKNLERWNKEIGRA